MKHSSMMQATNQKVDKDYPKMLNYIYNVNAVIGFIYTISST